MKIEDVMTSSVISVTSDVPLSDIAENLFEKNLTGVPVVDDNNHVIGIITEYDLLSRQEHIHIPTYMKLLSQFRTAGNKSAQVEEQLAEIHSLKASDVMTRPVVTISSKTDVAEAARIFADERINPLPVVDEHGVLIGIISRADIVKLFRGFQAA